MVTDKVQAMLEMVTEKAKAAYETSLNHVERQGELVDSFEAGMDAAMVLQFGWLDAMLKATTIEEYVTASKHQMFWSQAVLMIVAVAKEQYDEYRRAVDDLEFYRVSYMKVLYRSQILALETTMAAYMSQECPDMVKAQECADQLLGVQAQLKELEDA